MVGMRGLRYYTAAISCSKNNWRGPPYLLAVDATIWPEDREEMLSTVMICEFEEESSAATRDLKGKLWTVTASVFPVLLSFD